MTTYPQETKEFQPIKVTVDGVEVLTGVEFAVVPTNTRPSSWVSAITLDNNTLAVLIDQLEPRTWNVWARVTTLEEIVVVYCGNFKVTN